ncbi:MAG: M50 family metallopeptidase [Coriobacteriia bacterium]|nr:M50 family metallopeptidase [Coriobacteriia bacterium]
MSLGISAIIWGIITLSLLIVLHEGGHFFAARALGVRVREFMIGLPGPKLSFTRKGIRYGVTAIPLGGYVKIVGMEGDVHNPLLAPMLAHITKHQTATYEELEKHFDIDERTVAVCLMALKDFQAVTEDDDGTIHAVFPSARAAKPAKLLEEAQRDSYITLPTYKRLVILSAGVVLNVAAALLVFFVVLTTVGLYADTGMVSPLEGGPAAEAGLPHDVRITVFAGIAVEDFNELAAQIPLHAPGDVVLVEYVHEEERDTSPGVIYRTTSEVEVTLGTNPETGATMLGIVPQFEQRPLTPLDAIRESFHYVGMTVEGIAGFFIPTRFTESVANSSSVIGISVIAAQTASTGAIEYAWLIAAISLSLGLINLVPIPPLDGGKIVLELVEKIRRKPLPLNVNLGFSVVGFALLFSLMIYLMYVDVGRLMAG